MPKFIDVLTKRCSSCHETKTLDCFYKQSANKDGLAYRCKFCDKKARSVHSKTLRGKELTRNRNRKCKYGVSPEQFKEMWDSQEGKCTICSVDLDDSFIKQHRTNKAVIDHCHDTGKVRGLLCTKCNKGLGLFNDCHLAVYSAYKYLTK